MNGPRMLRPMTYGEIFNEAFDLYKRNFALFAGIGAVAYIPAAVANALTVSTPVLQGLLSLVFLVPLIAVDGAVIKALSDRYLDRDATIVDSWRYILRRLGRYILTVLLGGLVVSGAFLLLCLPGFVAVFWQYFFLYSVMVIEDRYYRDALRRSWALASGQWGRIIVFALLLVLIVGVLFGIVFLGAAAFLGPAAILGDSALNPGTAEAPLAAMVVWQLVSGALQTFFTPIFFIASVLFYFDVRVRKEGFDIELLAREMGEPPAGSGPGVSPA